MLLLLNSGYGAIKTFKLNRFVAKFSASRQKIYHRHVHACSFVTVQKQIYDIDLAALTPETRIIFVTPMAIESLRWS